MYSSTSNASDQAETRLYPPELPILSDSDGVVMGVLATSVEGAGTAWRTIGGVAVNR